MLDRVLELVVPKAHMDVWVRAFCGWVQMGLPEVKVMGACGMGLA